MFAGGECDREFQRSRQIGLALGTGVRMVATEKIHTQGNLVQTNNSLDVAIQGRGYFQVLSPDGGLAYSRNGAFQMNSQGQVVTAQGYLVQPAISVPSNATSLTIGSDGTVSALTPGSATPTQIGNLQLADFVNPTGLQAVGENLFKESGSSGSPQIGTPNANGLGGVIQGSLETSNVNVVEELVDMIEAHRAYELNSKAIATTDQMLQYVNQNL